jgi:hypothetical protein
MCWRPAAAAGSRPRRLHCIHCILCIRSVHLQIATRILVLVLVLVLVLQRWH